MVGTAAAGPGRFGRPEPAPGLTRLAARRAFRFGLSANRPRPRQEWVDFARRVEALGYDVLQMPDHFGPRLSIAPALVAAAQATSRLRVGSFVYDNDFRHPALLAQEVATIDTLSDGRFDFGIGAGWLKSEYDATGLAFDPGAVRLQRLVESLEIITRLLEGEAVRFAGQHYRVVDLKAGFATVQRPLPPILIGGGGRRLLAMAAQQADIISVMPRSRADGSGLADEDASEASFQEKVQWVAEAAGERFSKIELNTLVQAVVLTDDLDKAAEELASEWKMPAATLLASPLLLIGSAESIAARLMDRRKALGISFISVFEKDMESFSQVIPRLRKLDT